MATHGPPVDREADRPGPELHGDSFAPIADWADGAMVVVTATDGEDVDACLVGFHCQCSIEPLRYAVWLSKANRTYEIAERAHALTVHWLSLDARPIAAGMGTVSKKDDPAKMDRIAWRLGGDGTVVVDGAAAVLSGRVHDRHDDGDHVCFVLAPYAIRPPSPGTAPLRFTDVADLDAGQPADEA